MTCVEESISCAEESITWAEDSIVCADDSIIGTDESIVCADEIAAADESIVCAIREDPSTGEKGVLNREGGIGERGGSVSIRAMGTFSSDSAVEISCGEEALGGRLETVAELVMPK